MPSNAAEMREEQLKTLKSISNGILSKDETAQLFEDAGKDHNLSDFQKRNLHLMKKIHENVTLIPEDLQQKLISASVKCQTKWAIARDENDFASYAPLQSEVLKIKREIAQIKAENSGKSAYDCLLDEFEENVNCAFIEPIFKDLGNFLPGFVNEVIEKQKSLNFKDLSGSFSSDGQRELSLKIMKMLNFDFSKGRLDETIHPFCSGSGNDIRIATKFRESEFVSSLFGTIHETGHALYEFGTDEKWRSQPIGKALGMMIHESQSLFMEMQIALSKPFLKMLLPQIKQIFPKFQLTSEEFCLSMQKVSKSLIRIEADEVTYPLHIIMRFELEQKLMNGELEIQDLPSAWNEKTQKFFGLTPKNFKEGCMQDIHWTDGSFGYFPHYSLGAITAAAFAEKMRKDLPNSELQIEEIVSWLKNHIHSKSSKLTAQELIKEVTGENLSITPYINHLKNRYL